MIKRTGRSPTSRSASPSVTVYVNEYSPLPHSMNSPADTPLMVEPTLALEAAEHSRTGYEALGTRATAVNPAWQS